MLCDFCMGDYPIVATIKAKSSIGGLMVTGQVLVDDGEWASCQECYRLIEAKDWITLGERGVLGTIAMHPELATSVMEITEKHIELLRAVFGDEAFINGKIS